MALSYKVKHALSYDPAITFLGTYSSEMNTHIHINTYMNVYRGFIHNHQKLETPNCSSISKWISKLRTFACVLERSQPKRLHRYYSIWHSGKGKPGGMENRSETAGDIGRETDYKRAWQNFQRWFDCSLSSLWKWLRDCMHLSKHRIVLYRGWISLYINYPLN